MKTVKFKFKQGTISKVVEGVFLLESSDLYPSFKEIQGEQDTDQDSKVNGQPLSLVNGVTLSSQVKPRSFASLQLRAKNAMRALFKQKQEHLLVICNADSIDGIQTCYDLVEEVTSYKAVIAYAPTKFELFGNDKEDGLITTGSEDNPCVVIMPCIHLNDHPKWLGMLDACLAQNPYLKLILVGDATDVAQLSMIWPNLSNAIHSDFVLEFSAQGSIETLCALISHYQKVHDNLLAFNIEAVRLLATWCCRISGDRRYIGILELKLQSLIFEANNFALQRYTDLDLAQACVNKHDVLKAICANDFRNNFLAESVLRDHRDQQLLICTDGAVIGQINGLSVIETLGTSYEYGEPVRITATIRAGGEGDVIDIERKAELAGQIHAKAMMIINGFITRVFSSEQPLPVSASLVFEQSYSEVDGDSASLTGLCAILSGLASVPIRQGLAVTGAVDQFGDVQAVGGVNEKIEGFFRVCRLHGLTGTQGVIIPASCVHQLVLRPSVVQAVKEGKFHIFTVTHVTQAMKLLTTLDWGDAETEGTICYRICERLSSIIDHNQEEPWYSQAFDVAQDFCCDLYDKVKELFKHKKQDTKQLETKETGESVSQKSAKENNQSEQDSSQVSLSKFEIHNNQDSTNK